MPRQQFPKISGPVLRAERKRKGLNVAELGALIGISGSSIQAWECEYHGPSREKLVRLAKALGVPLETLQKAGTQPIQTRGAE